MRQPSGWMHDEMLYSKEAFRRAGGVEDEVNVAAFAEALEPGGPLFEFLTTSGEPDLAFAARKQRNALCRALDVAGDGTVSLLHWQRFAHDDAFPETRTACAFALSNLTGSELAPLLAKVVGDGAVRAFVALADGVQEHPDPDARARIPSGLLPDQDSPNAVSDLPRVSSDGRRMSTPMSTSTRKRIAKLRWQGSEGGNSLVKDDGAHAIEAMEASVVSSYSASCSSSNADKEKATDEERV